MKEKIIFNERIDIPDIVNDKCNMAYEQIRNEAKMPVRKIHHRKKITVTAIVLAATLACGIPAAASYFKSAFNVISNEVYTKNPAMQMDLSPYAEDVNKNSSQTIADITMQSVYCDGENLSIAFALKPSNEQLKGMTKITAYIKTKLGDTKLTDVNGIHTAIPVYFYVSDDGIFYGTATYQNLSVADNTKLEVEILNLKGENEKYLTWIPDNPNKFYDGGYYETEKTDIFNDKFSFEATVSPDTSNNKLYEVNETQGGITLESIYVTPFKTEIKISGFGKRQSFRVLDNDGNKFEFMNESYSVITDDNDIDNFVHYLSSPLKTAKQLKIEVYDLDTDNFPAEYTFTVDIEKGFAEKYILEWDGSDIVYDPPFEEMEKHRQEEYNNERKEFLKTVDNIEKIPVNTSVSRKEWLWINKDGSESEEVETSQKIVSSKIEDFNNYRNLISEDELRWLEDGENFNADTAKMVLITYEIENKSDVAGTMCFNGFEFIVSKDFEFSKGEPEYMPDKEHGGHSSYMYDFAPYETKTITLGYAVSEEFAENGFYALNYGDFAFSNTMYKGIENGKIDVMEIE